MSDYEWRQVGITIEIAPGREELAKQFIEEVKYWEDRRTRELSEVLFARYEPDSDA